MPETVSQPGDPQAASGSDPNFERFYVATVSGWLGPTTDERGPRASGGLTASVLDRGNLHREVARYRSEGVRKRGQQARDDAIRRATVHAKALNEGRRLTRRELRGGLEGLKHGLGYTYKMGCRCARCRAANAEASRTYDAQQRARKQSS